MQDREANIQAAQAVRFISLDPLELCLLYMLNVCTVNAAVDIVVGIYEVSRSCVSLCMRWYWALFECICYCLITLETHI